MVLLLSGASHSGKTILAQKILEKYNYPYLSIDHLKMGLIRSGMTALSPESPDDALTSLLWPIVREIIKTAIENGQNLTVEGCYIPPDWQNDFGPEYLRHIKYLCLIMSAEYIRKHFADIKKYANVIEQRLEDGSASMSALQKDNEKYHNGCLENGLNRMVINNRWPGHIGLEDFR